MRNGNLAIYSRKYDIPSANKQRGKRMPKVNLDALIPREDLKRISQSEQGIATDVPLFKITDLIGDSFFFSAIRKPDFQRTTDAWGPEAVCGLIESVINEDLVTAIILWRTSDSFTFIIDGSHRLSAIAAWVRNDYGDGSMSRISFPDMSEKQKRLAKQTRDLVNLRVGEFQEYQDYLKDPSSARPEIAKKARGLAFKGIKIQWLTNSDAEKAAEAFLRINTKAVEVGDTELELIKTRNKPSGLAARAMINGGGGHQYWKNFPDDQISEILELSQTIHNTLFKPIMTEPAKTLYRPTAGKIYTDETLQLVVKFTNIVNGIPIQKKSTKKKQIAEPENVIADDIDGRETVRYLKNCRRVALLINSNQSGSLGLHPAVYFYSMKGAFKPVSFHAMVVLVMEYEKNNKLRRFTEARKEFEQFLITQDKLVQWLIRKYGDAAEGYLKVKEIFDFVINLISEGKRGSSILENIYANPGYRSFPRFEHIPEATEQTEFDKPRKSEAYIRRALPKEERCDWCKAFLPAQAIGYDHKIPKREQGRGGH